MRLRIESKVGSKPFPGESRLFPNWLPVGLALLLSVTPGCKKAETASDEGSPGPIIPGDVEPAGEAKPSKGGELPPATVTRDPAGQERLAYRRKVRPLFNQSQFQELEAEAQKARERKLPVGPFFWQISEFYESLELQEQDYPRYAETHIRIYAAWKEAYPQSITARVAYANFLTNYAWEARGSGYANTVTNDGQRLFEERLNQARTVLEEASSLEAKCPMWWSVMMTVALGQGWDRPEYDHLFAEAKAFAPDFWLYDKSRAYFLLPRWYGKKGEWETVAAREAEKDAASGAEIYARIVCAQNRFHDNVFRQSNASWSITRQGFESLRRKYPNSLELLSMFTKMAGLADDKPLARELFGELGGRQEPSVWANATEFVVARERAFAERR